MFLNKGKKYRLKTDEELVDLYKSEGNTLCIAILYERYSHLVMGTAMKYLRNEMEAQDITMQLFSELAEKITKHSIQHFKSWLYTVTKNDCFQLLRKNKKEQSCELSDSAEEPSELEQLQKKEIHLHLLEKAVNELKPEQQQCIQLFYIEEKSYQQISEMLKIPLLKVKSAIQNGKRNIKLKLVEQDAFKEII